MSIQFSIRQMAHADVPKTKGIIEMSFSRFMGFFAFLSVREETEGEVIVAEAQGNVVGFAKLKDFKISHEKYGCILWISVHPSFRRKGVASALTADGIRRLKQGGAKAVFASTQRRKTGVLILLGRKGFRRISFRELWRIFGWRVFEFFAGIWLGPGEVILKHD